MNQKIAFSQFTAREKCVSCFSFLATKTVIYRFLIIEGFLVIRNNPLPRYTSSKLLVFYVISNDSHTTKTDASYSPSLVGH